MLKKLNKDLNCQRLMVGSINEAKRLLTGHIFDVPTFNYTYLSMLIFLKLFLYVLAFYAFYGVSYAHFLVQLVQLGWNLQCLLCTWMHYKLNEQKPKTLMISHNYLLDKIIPSILKISPKKKSRPTLVCGFHWSSP